MTSCIVSPISWRSPCMRVIRLKEVLEAFDFFCGPTCSLGCWWFNYVDAVGGSVPPSSVLGSSSGDDDLWPSCSFSVACCSMATFCYSVATFVTSRASCAFCCCCLFSFLLCQLHHLQDCLLLLLLCSILFYFLHEDGWSSPLQWP